MYTSTLKQHSLIENENQKARLEGTNLKLIDKPFQHKDTRQVNLYIF